MKNNATEMVILVDESDNQIGVEEKLRAHELGLLHRAFSVFIFRSSINGIELLLQQRQQEKYHCGGLWTNTCCSHPRVGENIVQAGVRRLQEEMGIKAKLQLLGAFTYRAEFTNGLVEHEYDHTLIGVYNGEPINFNSEEVQAHRWISVADLQQELSSSPELFTPWLEGTLAIVRANWHLVQEYFLQRKEA